MNILKVSLECICICIYFLTNWKNIPLILYSCSHVFVSGFKSDTRYKCITVSSLMKSLDMKTILFVLFNNRYFICLYIHTHCTFVIMKLYHRYILNMENSNNRNYYRWIQRNLIIFIFVHEYHRKNSRINTFLLFSSKMKCFNKIIRNEKKLLDVAKDMLYKCVL